MTAVELHPEQEAGTLPVSEVFGPTFQGEGPHCGRRTAFVRLGYCNLACSWCDTPYTWDHTRFDVKAQCPPRTITEILAAVAAMNVRRVVLSGGEPMLWTRGDRPELYSLLAQSTAPAGGLPWPLAYSLSWDCETNGTITPPPWWPTAVELTTVSPKLSHSGDPESRRIVPGALSQWSDLAHRLGPDRVAFKFVATHPRDLDEIDHLVDGYRLPHDQVWVMPEGTSLAAVVAGQDALCAPVLARGYNLTTRLHVLLWGDQRGR